MYNGWNETEWGCALICYLPPNAHHFVALQILGGCDASQPSTKPPTVFDAAPIIGNKNKYSASQSQSRASSVSAIQPSTRPRMREE